MLFTLVFLAVVVVSGEARSIISSASKDGQSQSLRKLTALWTENSVPREDNTLYKQSFASSPSPHLDNGKRRDKRDVSQANVPQLTIAANLPNESVCPWTYRIDSKVDRRPVDLVEAVCIQSNSTDSVCLRIFYFIPVQVKMTSPDGTVTWVDKLERKVVGCTRAVSLSAMIVQGNDSNPTRD